jgi:release factor glutamine methyltransferase
VRPREAVTAIGRELAAAGVPDGRTDAEILVAHVLGVRRSALHEPERELDERAHAELARLVRRRREREPLQYVLGEWGFRRLTLRVDARALVPRPETEVVVERCLAALLGTERPRVLDVGTGCGAIALALADEHRGVRVLALDASPAAAELARENAARTGLADRVEVVVGDVRDGLRGRFDLVVSNPPYVRPDEVSALEPEIREHEPMRALVADGVTEAVAAAAFDALVAGGRLVLETAAGAAPALADLLGRLGYADVTVTTDLAGLDRVVEGCRP